MENMFLEMEVLIYRVESFEDIVEICNKYNLQTHYFRDPVQYELDGGYCIRVSKYKDEDGKTHFGHGAYNFYISEGLIVEDWISESKYIVELL